MRLAERLIRRFGVSDEEVEKRIKVYNNGYDEGYKQAMIDIQPILNRALRSGKDLARKKNDDGTVLPEMQS